MQLANFKTEMFRTYGTLDMVVEISVRHMNVTANDNALISKTDYSGRYSLPPIFIGAGCLPLGNGHKGDNENRPRENFFQGKTLFRTEQN